MSHIIARGGGGLSCEPADLALNRYTLDLTGLPRPKVCFLPTASGDDRDAIIRFLEAFGKLRCEPSYVTLFRRTIIDVEAHLRAQDVIWVGGGNTRNMLALWREWGIDRVLRELWQAGTILTGSSAGGICWFEQGLTDSIPTLITGMDALGFLPGTFCPHYDSEPLRQPTFRELVATGRIQPGIACDDGAAAHFVDGALTEALAWKPGARLVKVTAAGGEAREEILETRYVGP